MKRTVRVLVLFFLLFFISLSGSSTGLALAQNQKVHLAWVAVGGAMAPVWIAQELNLYNKYGLDAELTAGSRQDFPDLESWCTSHRSMEQKLAHAPAFKEQFQIERPILIDDLNGNPSGSK